MKFLILKRVSTGRRVQALIGGKPFALFARCGNHNEIFPLAAGLDDPARNPLIGEPAVAFRFVERRVYHWVFCDDLFHSMTREIVT